MTKVSRAENRLKAAGYTVKRDGKLDRQEQKELKQFQAATGLEATGAIDGKTAGKLQNVATQAKRHEGLNTGEKRESIARTEKRLKALGYQVGKADGVLDRRTAAAIRAFKHDTFEGQGSKRLTAGVRDLIRVSASGANRTEAVAAAQSGALLRNGDGLTGTAEQGTVVANGRDSNDLRDLREPVAAALVHKNLKAENEALGKLSREDRIQYRQVKETLVKSRDTHATLALQTMLLEGKLPGGRDRLGQASTLQYLSGVASGATPMSPSINRQRFLCDLVQELNSPAAINQGPVGSCAPTTLAIDLAMDNPAEYARIATQLASPSGTTTLAGGMQIARPAGTEVDDGTGRSAVQRLMGSAFFEVSNGERAYSKNDAIGSYASDLDTLYGQLKGQPTGSRYFWNDFQKANAMKAIDEMLAAGRRVSVGVTWGDSAHKILVTGNDGQNVDYINPWGTQERMSLADFRTRLSDLNFDRTVVSAQTQAELALNDP